MSSESDSGSVVPSSDGGADADRQVILDAAEPEVPLYYDADTADAPLPDEGNREGCLDGVAGCSETCGNAFDDDGDGLSDCLDLGCLGCPSCCLPVDTPSVHGEFRGCPSLSECRWTPFFGAQDGASAVRVGEQGVTLGGDGVGEVGLFAQQEFGLTGEPMVTFRSSLDREACSDQGGCWQVLGVALTAQSEPSAGTGVVPLVGLVLDGEQGGVHAFVNGRRERSEAVDLEVLTEPHLHGFRVNHDGRVDFWIGGRGESVDELGAPSFTSTATVDTRTHGLKVVIFGRLRGEQVAAVEWLRLDRMICDVPDAWARLLTRPVLETSHAAERLMSPSVVRGFSGELLMVFETEAGLELAVSDDDGRRWERQGPILTSQAPTAYGRVARRSPSIVVWAPGGEGTRRQLHLWFECEAEVTGTSPPGIRPTAICHAVSDDGQDWVEPEESAVALEGDVEQPWRAEVSDPTVAVTERGRLMMWYIGREPATGATSLLQATSSDGVSWSTLDENLLEADGEPLLFERDGVAAPTVLIRGGAYLLWYVGLSGSRSTLGYAVSGDGRRFERFGPVLEAALPWEASHIGGATVLSFPSEEGAYEIMHLWYEGGPPGRERVGLALRDLPPLELAGE